MKYIIQIFAVIAVIALLTACSSTSKGTEKNTSADAGAATEVYIDVTDAPTEAATEAPTDPPYVDAASQEEEVNSSADNDKSELVDHQWKLTKLYKNGEERKIYVEYGSVVRQSGTYIQFNDDDTFECVLGVIGCKGTYAVENGDVALHITTKYTGKNEGDACDEYETAKWDHEAGTLSFDLNGYTNVFSKQN